MKKIHRFFYDFEINDDVVVIKDSEIINQIKNVLKININEKISLFFNNKEIVCVVEKIDRKNIVCKFLEEVKIKVKNRKVILYCSILKKDNFEFVIQKACEVGVDEVVPIITERTIKNNLNLERLNKISKEACEQSGRIELMKIGEIRYFEKCLNNKNDLNILFDFVDKKIINYKLNEKQIGIFIGPEGGFTEKEVELAKKNNFEILRLGDNVLKAETASVVASYIVVNY